MMTKLKGDQKKKIELMKKEVEKAFKEFSIDWGNVLTSLFKTGQNDEIAKFIFEHAYLLGHNKAIKIGLKGIEDILTPSSGGKYYD